jgi:hypothetical protein
MIRHRVMGRIVVALLAVCAAAPLIAADWSPMKAVLLSHLAIAVIFGAALLPDFVRAVRNRWLSQPS